MMSMMHVSTGLTVIVQNVIIFLYRDVKLDFLKEKVIMWKFWNRKKVQEVFNRIFRGTPYTLDLKIFDYPDFHDVITDMKQKGLDIDVDWKKRSVTIWT